MQKRRTPSPALVISMIALFVALGGTAYASGLISGAQIKNHTIAKKKLTKSAILSLRGQRGPRGYAGPTGPTGATGPGATSGGALLPDQPSAAGFTTLFTLPNGVTGKAICDSTTPDPVQMDLWVASGALFAFGTSNSDLSSGVGHVDQIYGDHLVIGGNSYADIDVIATNPSVSTKFARIDIHGAFVGGNKCIIDWMTIPSN